MNLKTLIYYWNKFSPLAVTAMIIQATPFYGYSLNGCGGQCFGQIAYFKFNPTPPFFKVLKTMLDHSV